MNYKERKKARTDHFEREVKGWKQRDCEGGGKERYKPNSVEELSKKDYVVDTERVSKVLQSRRVKEVLRAIDGLQSTANDGHVAQVITQIERLKPIEIALVDISCQEDHPQLKHLTYLLSRALDHQEVFRGHNPLLLAHAELLDSLGEDGSASHGRLTLDQLEEGRQQWKQAGIDPLKVVLEQGESNAH